MASEYPLIVADASHKYEPTLRSVPKFVIPLPAIRGAFSKEASQFFPEDTKPSRRMFIAYAEASYVVSIEADGTLATGLVQKIAQEALIFVGGSSAVSP